ncbi:MAG: glycerophosphodiester phosphodiesterase family protein [Bacteroidota bacterium]
MHNLPSLWIQRVWLLLLFPFLLVCTGCQTGKERLPEGFDLQGHRGAMGLKPENTLSSFYEAVDLGVTTIEFDLAVSREHQLVISHEPWFRTDICLQPDGSPIPPKEERRFRIYELDAAEIARFDCGSLQHPSHPEQQTVSASKPLMSQAIAAVDEYVQAQGRPPIHYNIEIKSNPEWDAVITPAPDVFARLVHEELLSLEAELQTTLRNRVNVQSFDPRPLHAFRDMAPNIPLAILTYTEERVDDHLDYFGLQPDIYSPNYGILTPEHVNRAHELGMRVIPWTVNNKDDMQRMMELGVDGLITDYPNRFNELYRRRTDR